VTPASNAELDALRAYVAFLTASFDGAGPISFIEQPPDEAVSQWLGEYTQDIENYPLLLNVANRIIGGLLQELYERHGVPPRVAIQRVSAREDPGMSGGAS
jgi:hypothetical protein